MKLVKAYAITVVVLATSASMVVAHSDATNPAVIKRMEAMKAIGASMKTLSGMAKGEMSFDAAKANTAVATIAEKGMKTTALFEANETDHSTEALPAIWENWDDFVTKSDDMVMAAKGVTEISDQGTLGAALGQIGGTCKACHDDYRKK